jgi:prepilin-type N-terminal cleavage/methylation domain-containing protein
MFHKQDQQGFTLIELMMAVTILGILFSGLHNTFQAQERAYALQAQVVEMNQISRVSMDIMTRHIRSAACDPTGLAGARIQTATAQTFVYTKDVDGDGSISSDGEWLGFRYDADDSEIEQCSGSTDCTEDDWYPLVPDIQNLQFRYIYADGDSSDAGDAGMPDDTDDDDSNDFADIREVEIQVVALRSGGYGDTFGSRTLTSQVLVRNLALQ